MVDDHIIDIREYLADSLEDRSPGTFAVWGGGGSRSRLALPLWRAIYLAKGDWGGIVSVSRDGPGTVPKPIFILDLRQEPARLECPQDSIRILKGEAAPAVACTPEAGVAVLMGGDPERYWYLLVQGSGEVVVPKGKDRETLLFLAGECAGLLFFRELATPFPSSS
jgi:hypothetical protein